ncbi:hypothetical protein PRIPAC_79662 [Pristionchus pacificus]|uniref:HLH domain containing protein n=1 Tax=Pristionchus pacificus TaxID=54126 RepID=A0A2A6BY93_PRIPA|nr:hypothetical protein PRIPAC_79662 [Pristionchus pacificus]|eukprot:PDM70839.1 HLH domain containing protein [Pristionchus pacificus]
MAAHRRYSCPAKRREANRRERLRMERMNTAFAALRETLFRGGESPLMSRVTTLRLSINYIHHLLLLLHSSSPSVLSSAITMVR